MGTTWGCECQRYFIETEDRNSKGNPIFKAIDVRKMHIRGEFVFTDYYKVSIVRRGGENSFCVKQRIKPKRPWWDKSEIKEDEYKWKREGRYTREQFIQFLTGVVPNAEAAVVELETCPPDNIKDAA